MTNYTQTPSMFGEKVLDLITYLMCVHSDRNAESPGQTKVSQLDHTIVIDEQILRFQISV